MITRLDETCREVRDAARVIGDADLFTKMEEAQGLIKRDSECFRTPKWDFLTFSRFCCFTCECFRGRVEFEADFAVSVALEYTLHLSCRKRFGRMHCWKDILLRCPVISVLLSLLQALLDPCAPADRFEPHRTRKCRSLTKHLSVRFHRHVLLYAWLFSISH